MHHLQRGGPDTIKQDPQMSLSTWKNKAMMMALLQKAELLPQRYNFQLK
jgi:hypothetical protein